MTQQEYQIAYKRANTFGNLLAIATMIVLGVSIAFGIEWYGPWLHAFGAWAKDEFESEVLAGAIGGVLASVMSIVPMTIALLVLWWAHRRFGVQCPMCGRSLTLLRTCRHVRHTGKCCWCNTKLFDPAPTQS